MSKGATAATVGHELGVSADTVRRHHAEWTAAKGFPRPIFDTPFLRWDLDQVVAWKQRRSAPSIAPAPLEPDWAAIARLRGLALDAGRDPDFATA